jgi:hypothetical protein
LISYFHFNSNSNHQLRILDEIISFLLFKGIAIQINSIIWSYIAKELAKRVGRIEACLLLLNLGLVCLFLFIFGQYYYWHNKVQPSSIPFRINDILIK